MHAEMHARNFGESAEKTRCLGQNYRLYRVCQPVRLGRPPEVGKRGNLPCPGGHGGIN